MRYSGEVTPFSVIGSGHFRAPEGVPRSGSAVRHPPLRGIRADPPTKHAAEDRPEPGGNEGVPCQHDHADQPERAVFRARDHAPQQNEELSQEYAGHCGCTPARTEESEHESAAEER